MAQSDNRGPVTHVVHDLRVLELRNIQTKTSTKTKTKSRRSPTPETTTATGRRSRRRRKRRRRRAKTKEPRSLSTNSCFSCSSGRQPLHRQRG